MRGLLLVALCIVGLLYAASQMQQKARWARAVCDHAITTCDSPRWLLITAAIIIFCYALTRWTK
jgi:hypothetical protein